MYDYLDSMKQDILDELDEYPRDVGESREDYERRLNDELWANDSVTGNGSGSYTFSTWQAREYVQDWDRNGDRNWDYLLDAVNEFGIGKAEFGTHLLDEDWEWCDVTIRCYLLGQAITKALDAKEAQA